MKGDERLERAQKRTNEHIAKLVKANVEKAEAEKKAKLDEDIEVDTGVGEAHEASSLTEMSTGSGIKRAIDTDRGIAMIDVETTGKRMRVNWVVELVAAKAVVNEMEELMDEDWSCGLEADECVVQSWEKGEKELAEASKEKVKYMVEKLNMFEFCFEDAMKAVTSEASTTTKWVDVRKMIDDGEEFIRSGTRQAKLVHGDASTGGEEDAIHHDRRWGCLREARNKGRAEVDVHRCAQGALERRGG